jgi:hypothetical protein
MSEPNEDTWVVMSTPERETIEGRAAAVARAKDLSRASGGRVVVERADGKVVMQFEKGSLEAFSAETREKTFPGEEEQVAE